MSGKYETIRLLGQIYDQIVAAAAQALRRLFNNDGPLIPIPVRAVADRRRLDRHRSRD